MAKGISTDIKVNLDFKTNIQDTINLIIAQSNGCKSAIENAINNPAERSIELLDEILYAFKQATNNAEALNGAIPEQQFKGVINELNVVLDKFTQLKQLTDITVGDKFIDTGFIKNIENISFDEVAKPLSAIDETKQQLGVLYNECRGIIDEVINNPALRSEELLNNLQSKISTINSKVFSLDGLIREDTLTQIMGLAQGLMVDYDKIKAMPFHSTVFEDSIARLNEEIHANQLMNDFLDEQLAKEQAIADAENARIEKLAEELQIELDIEKAQQNKEKAQQEWAKAYIDILGSREADWFDDWFDELIDGRNAESLEVISEEMEEASENTSNFNFNSEQLVESLLDIVRTGKLTDSTIAGLAKSFGVAGVYVTLIITAFNLLKKAINEVIETVKECKDETTEMLEALGSGVAGGFDFTLDTLKDLVDILNDAINKMYEFSEIGVEAQKGYFTLSNYLGDASDEIITFTNNLEEAYNLDASGLVNNMRGILGTVRNMGLEAKNATDTIKAFTMFGQDLAAFSGYSFSEVTSQLESAINLGTINAKSPIVRALDLTKEDVEKFRELNGVQERANFLLSKGEQVRGTYEKWLKTSAGKVEQLHGSMDVLNTSLGKLSTGLLAKLAPALTAIVELVNKVVSGIAELVHIDLTDIEGDSGVAVESYENIAGAIDGVGESADKAKNKTRSFDDLISVNKDDTSVEDALVGGFDIGAWADSIDDINDEKTELEIILDEFYKLLSDKKYREAGKYLADSINNLLSDINWSDIKAKFHAGGAIIASVFSNILNTKDLFGNVGGLLGNGLNTLMNGISGFLFGDFNSMNPNGFDFKGFGEALGIAWKEYWDTFDSTELGRILEGVFTGAVDFVNGWLTGGGLVNIADSISDTIVGFFTHFSEEDALDTANALVGLVDNAFDAVQTLLNNMKEHPEILQGIKNVIKSTLENIKNNSSSWGSTLNELITTIYDTASALLLSNKDLIAEGVGNFLEKLDIVDILFSWLTMKLSLLWTKAQSWIDGLVEEVLGWIINPIGKIGEAIGERLYEVGSKAFTSFKDALKEGFSNFSLDDLSIGAVGIGTKFGKALGNWLAGGEFKLEELANGGVAYSATPVVIGDGGWEAVLPLTQNTGWAKQVADLININLPTTNNNSGGSVVVDMSGFNKQFYTRSELLEFGEHIIEALKLQGINVASLA